MATRTPEEARLILSREYRARCSRNPRYSLRAFARSLGVSHSLLSVTMAGKREVSPKLAMLVARNSEMAPNGPEAFHSMSTTDFEGISTWVHYAILSLLELPGVRLTPENISRRLAISSVEASQACRDLVSGGFIVKRLGKWRPSRTRLTLNNAQSTVASRRFIRGFLKKAEDSMDHEPFESRNLTTITFCMRERDLPYAARRIQSFRRSLSQELEEREGPDRVYTLAVQLFPLSQPSNRRSP